MKCILALRRHALFRLKIEESRLARSGCSPRYFADLAIEDKKPTPRTETVRLEGLRQAIDPEDLDGTLEAHREINSAAVLRKVYEDGKRMARSADDPTLNQPIDRVVAEHKRRNLTRRTVTGHQEVEDTQSAAPSASDLYPLEEYSPQTGFISSRLDREMVQKRIELLKHNETPYRGRQRGSGPMEAMPAIREVRNLLSSDNSIGGTVSPLLMEYEGRIIQVQPTILAPPGSQAIWERPGEGQSKTVMEWLNTEIADFFEWMKLTRSEKQGRNRVTRKLFAIVNKYAGDIACERYGSQRTGLVLPQSDLDMRVFHRLMNRLIFMKHDLEHNRSRVEAPGIAVAELAKALLNNQEFMLVTQHKGRFAVLSATHRSSGVQVQIVAAPPSYEAQDRQKHYIAVFPHLKAVYTVLKTTFDLRKLSDPFTGGLGAYSIFNMVVASLHLHQSPKLDRPFSYTTVDESDGQQLAELAAQQSPAEQILDFLRFYGTELNTYQHGLVVATGQLFRKGVVEDHVVKGGKGLSHISRISRFQPYLLCLQDPASPANDLGRQAYAIKHIQTTLAALYKSLDDFISGKRDGDAFGVLQILVKRCDLLYDQRRAQLELYGEGNDGAEDLGPDLD